MFPCVVTMTDKHNYRKARLEYGKAIQIQSLSHAHMPLPHSPTQNKLWLRAQSWFLQELTEYQQCPRWHWAPRLLSTALLLPPITPQAALIPYEVQIAASSPVPVENPLAQGHVQICTLHAHNHAPAHLLHNLFTNQFTLLKLRIRLHPEPPLMSGQPGSPSNIFPLYCIFANQRG